MTRAFAFAILLSGLLTLSAHAAAAQDDEPGEETEQKLEKARERLEEAAREVAELSAELGGDVATAVAGLDFGMRRAMLGINIGGPGDGNTEGVEVAGVSPGGPADEAGIRAGDVLVSVQGESLTAGSDSRPVRRLFEVMREIEPGDRVTVDYLRDGREQTAEIEAEEFGPHAFVGRFGAPDFSFDLGFPGRFAGSGHFFEHFFSQWGRMELASLTPQLGEYFGTDEGLLVVRAPENEDLMLRDGDVIVSIAGRVPENPLHAMRILRSYRPGETLRIDIVRKQEEQRLEFVMPENGGIEDARFLSPRPGLPVPARPAIRPFTRPIGAQPRQIEV